MRNIVLSLLVLAFAVLSACSASPGGGQSTQQQNQAESAGQPAGKEILTEEEAQLKALAHAGLKAEEVTGLRVEYDREDQEYEVDFIRDGWEYEYEIHAVSGTVLSSTQKRQG